MAATSVIRLPTAQRIKQAAGLTNDLRELLEWQSLDMLVWKDDFLGDIVYPEYATDISGTAAVALAVRAGQLNGEGRMDAGTDDDGRSGAALGLHFRGNRECVVACRMNLSAITAVKCEIGFTDALADAGAVNVLATPSYTADNAALWIFDTDDAGNSGNWQAIGVDSTVGMTKVEPTLAPVAAAFETMIVAVRPAFGGTVDGVARYMRLNTDGLLTYDSGWQGSAISADVLLTPWMFVQNRSATQRFLDIDYLAAWQRRGA